MTLVPYNKNDLNPVTYKRTSNLKIIDEFVHSELDCVRVDGYTHKSAIVCAQCLRVSVKRFGVPGIRVVQRKDDVFLVKVK